MGLCQWDRSGGGVGFVNGGVPIYVPDAEMHTFARSHVIGKCIGFSNTQILSKLERNEVRICRHVVLGIYDMHNCI